MLTTYRRHNRAKCRFTSRSDYRCKCPIWVTGTTRHAGLLFDQNVGTGQFLRIPTRLRDWNRVQELVRRWDIDGEHPKKKTKTTVAEWKELFMKDAESASGRNLKTETLRKYKHLFSQLETFAQNKGIVTVDGFRVEDLTEFRSTWKDGPLSSSKKLERLRSIYRFAVDRDWVEKNHALKLKRPKITDSPTLPYSDEQMTAIFKAAKESKRFAAHAVYAFILTMRYSGLRISDVTALAKVSLTGDRLRLYTAKTGEHVSIRLPDFVATALQSVKSTNPKYFFWTGHSKLPAAVSVWRKRIAKIFEDAKIADGHPHRFRDTFACSLLEAGVSLQDVSILLGHRSTKVTERHYAPWVKSRQDSLDKALAKVKIEEPQE